jgi:DNA repair exonuclease SbcCD ATPase subunit
MKIISLTALNLFSIEHLSTLHLQNRGLVLVTGYSHDEGSANGSGKSTVANKAIIWALFGQTAAGTKGDEVINRHTDAKGCTAELVLRDNRGTTCRITRTRQPAGLKYEKLAAKQPPNGLLPSDSPWVDVSRRSQSATQELINSDIGRDYISFMQTDFFGQGRNTSFLSFTPSQQTEVLEQILPIKELSEWSEYAKKSKKKLDETIVSCERMHAYWDGALSQVESVQVSAKQNSINWIAIRIGEITRISNDIAVYDASVKDKKRDLEATQLELSSLPHSQLTQRKVEYEALEKSMKQAQHDLDVCKSVQNKAEIDKALKEKEMLDIREDCPTCEQPLPEAARKKLMIRQHEIGGEVYELQETIVEAKHAVKGWDDHVVRVAHKYDSVKRGYAEAVEAVAYQNELNTSIYKLAKAIDPEKRMELVAELKRVEAGVNPFESEIENADVDQKRILETLHRYHDSEQKLKKEREYLESWTNIFGKDFKTFLFKRACPFLERKTAEHLSGLGNDQLKVEFSTSKTLKSGDEKAGFSIKVYSETGGLGYDSLSGGEQQMVSFAVGLALADLAETQVKGGSNLLILDEPFMALDDRNCENLVTYLTSELNSRRETILLISNEENLKVLISERIHVEKSGGISSVEFGA